MFACTVSREEYARAYIDTRRILLLRARARPRARTRDLFPFGLLAEWAGDLRILRIPGETARTMDFPRRVSALSASIRLAFGHDRDREEDPRGHPRGRELYSVHAFSISGGPEDHLSRDSRFDHPPAARTNLGESQETEEKGAQSVKDLSFATLKALFTFEKCLSSPERSFFPPEKCFLFRRISRTRCSRFVLLVFLSP